jgi:simple sugar transport system permease protein
LSVTSAAKTSARGRSSLWSASPIVPPLITLVASFIVFAIFVPHFAQAGTLSGVLEAATINSIVVVGVSLLMIAGEFDLSVGATMALGGCIFAKGVLNGGTPWVYILLALLVCAAAGAINGLLTIGTGIPSFIVTLGTRSLYRAAVWIFSGGMMMQTTEKLRVYEDLTGRLDFVNRLLPGANLRASTVWALLLVIIFQVVLARTKRGNQVFATGGNPGAAIAQGVNVKRVKVLCFTLTGLLAGFAGVLTFSQFQTIFVATGSGLELTAIAASVVGGVLLTGGTGSIIGGLLGILLINMLRSGVILLGLPSDNFEAIVGITIVAAAILNEKIRSRG